MNEATISLFDDDIFRQTIERINRLTADTKNLWGKMNVSQMLSHCREVQEVLNGKELKNTPLIARIFKKMVRRVAVGPEAYKRNEITHPQYRISEEKEFGHEKNRLLSALRDFQTDKKSRRHILFGEMSVQERGWAAYKHLNHHLQQFGV